MFQNKNDNISNLSAKSSSPSAAGSLNFIQKNDSGNENISVHTMKDDLNNAADPDFSAKSAPVPSQTNANNENKPQRTSPFLSQENNIKKVSVEEKRKLPGLGKVVVIAIIIALLLIVSVGGYYFWMTKANNVPEIVVEEIPKEEESQPQIEQEEVLPEFSELNPNYLSLDIENIDQAGVKQKFQEYALRVSEAKIVVPVEFIVTDGKNNPVFFSDFAKKAGLVLSQDIMDQLDQNFSLYIYNNSGKVTLGLAILAKDEVKLKTLLLKEEKELTRGWEPLYMDMPHTLSDAIFSSSEYNGKNIRYFNIISPEELSLDYTVYDKRLFMGTTRMTLRSILDYAEQSKETPPFEQE